MMKRALAVAALVLAGALAALALHVATSRGDTMFSWKRPENLGVAQGRLAPCRRTPNCVSSQADPRDPVHYIAPIPFKGDAPAAMAAARKAIEAEERARVVRHEANYLYAEFRSRRMGFVDDVELTFDSGAGVIHVRSASRLGYGDRGVNRARVERLRAALSRNIKT